LHDVTITAPEVVKRGRSAEMVFTIRGSAQAPLNAVIPVRVDIHDANGRPAEFSGFYAADSGRLTVKLDIAENDDPGVWSVRLRELASHKESEHFIRVQP
jgi:hypothetical protein